MSNLPDLPRTPGAPPDRRLTPEQFEQVIRRAAELQARSADESPHDGISHAELIRIGKEIGISPQHVERALAETTASPAGERALPERLFGPAAATAGRTLPGDAESVRDHLDRYLVERERLAAVRRFADRTVYRPSRGLDLARTLADALDLMTAVKQPQVGAGFKLRNAREVEVSVQPLEAGFCYASLRVDLRNYRSGLATGAMLTGWGGGIGVATTLAIAVDPAAALLGLPVLGGSMWGFRAIQRHTAEHAQTHVESLLDCLERGEPLVRRRAGR